ncbi:MAG: methyl-accepting chemotaxis protein [Gammaproteobacteria bacterium]|nr:methyl-accepting chemotaxis protein [Gammaproteobacteria bacterium]
MRIRTKLLCGFGLLMGLMVAVAVMADWKVRFINTTLTEITDINAVKQRQAINFRGSVHDRAIAFRDLVLLEEQGELQRTLTQIDQLTLMYEEAARELDGIFASSAGHPDELQLLDAIKAIERRTLPMLARVSAAYDAGDLISATEVLVHEASPAFTQWLAAINRFIDWQELKSQVETTETRSVAAGFTRLMLIFCAIGLLVGGVLAWTTIRGIIQAVGRINAAGARMADGDLTVRIEHDSEDELAHIATSFNHMAERFQTMVRQLAEATGQLALAAEQTAAASEELTDLVERLQGLVGQFRT